MFWTTLAWLLHIALGLTDGHIVYALDDAYIHMAMAKHFARDGVWGVTPYEFSSSSSSLLWTALLASGYRVVGPNEAVPLVLNVIFGTVVLIVSYAFLRRRVASLGSLAALLAIIALVPLPAVVLWGMEHGLQIFVVTWFAIRSAATLATTDSSPRLPPSILALAALLPLVRYEGLFVVFVVGLLLGVRARPRDAILIAAAAIIPIVLYGGYSAWQGWLPIPNSIVIKALPRSVTEELWRLPRQLLASRILAAVLGIAIALLLHNAVRTRRRWTEDTVLLGIFVTVSLIHFQFTREGVFHRYDAYLTVLGIVAIASRLFEPETVGPHPSRSRSPALQAIRMVALALALTLAWRRGWMFQQTPIATQNIYQQQYQMGLFLAGAYAGQPVAANDIGAINYLADFACCDLMGLASMPIARLHLGGHRPSSEDVDRVVRQSHARIAVVYEHWLGNGYVSDGGVPHHWGTPIGRWVISNNVVCGGDTVAFFALQDGERRLLADRLREFSPRLPGGVIESGAYRSGD